MAAGADPETMRRLQEAVRQPNGWEKAWQLGITPWDGKGVTPAVASLVKSGSLPSGRALVPGCGSGYDVVALASPARRVVGLDMAESAIERARQLAEGEPGGPHATFISGDFFAYKPSELFDLAFDYTFFCALDPSLRVQWAQKYTELLQPDGELITLAFPIGEFTGGPPYAVSVEAYEEVLEPLGFEMTSNEVPESFPLRTGKERLMRWRRSSSAKI
eukprot:SM000049S16790  [mRNA]  locus=s49:661926:664341:- [translate_table: standard]